jgi:hypothetical protein
MRLVPARAASPESDHILFDGSFEPIDAWVVRAGSSDHLPVVAHLEASRHF